MYFRHFREYSSRAHQRNFFLLLFLSHFVNKTNLAVSETRFQAKYTLHFLRTTPGSLINIYSHPKTQEKRNKQWKPRFRRIAFLKKFRVYGDRHFYQFSCCSSQRIHRSGKIFFRNGNNTKLNERVGAVWRRASGLKNKSWPVSAEQNLGLTKVHWDLLLMLINPIAPKLAVPNLTVIPLPYLALLFMHDTRAIFVIRPERFVHYICVRLMKKSRDCGVFLNPFSYPLSKDMLCEFKWTVWVSNDRLLELKTVSVSSDPESLVVKASTLGAGGQRFDSQCSRQWGSFWYGQLVSRQLVERMIINS